MFIQGNSHRPVLAACTNARAFWIQALSCSAGVSGTGWLRQGETRGGIEGGREGGRERERERETFWLKP